MTLSLWKVTRAAVGAASKLLEVQLRGVGDEGDDAGAEPADRSVFLQQLGIAVRPVVARTLRALAYQFGDQVFTLKVWDKARAPTDLEEGETRGYSAGNGNVRFRLRMTLLQIEADVDIQINAGGHHVDFNGGTIPVAKEGSVTTGHTHGAGAFVAGPYAVTGLSGNSTDTIATGAGSATVRVP